MFDYLLFDFDGTLADTNYLIDESHLFVLNHYYPGKYTLDMVKPMNGPSLLTAYQEINPERAEEMVDLYRRHNAEVHDELIKPFPKVADSLAMLKNAGKKMAIVSSKKKNVVERGLECLDLTQYFDVVIAGGDTKEEKPNPEPVLLAMKKLAANPAKTIMVGDNWQDVAAGQNAKVASGFVSWSHKSLNDITPYKPDILIDDMMDFAQKAL